MMLPHSFPGCSLPMLFLLVQQRTLQHAAFEVSVRPPAPVVEYGGSVELNCTTTCRDPNAPGGLETSLTKKSIGNGTGWRAFRLVNITEWRSRARCYFYCDKKSTQMNVSITVYHRPERVHMEVLPRLTQGGPFTLLCRVINVAPIRNVTVTILKGGEILHRRNLWNYTGFGRGNVSVKHTITPWLWGAPQATSCRAVLDLTPYVPRFEKDSPVVQLRNNTIWEVDGNGIAAATAIAVAASAIAVLAAMLLAILILHLVRRRHN